VACPRRILIMAFDKPFKTTAFIAFCMVIALAAVFINVPAAGAADGITEVSTQFLGQVRDNNVLVPAGYTVEARIVGGGQGATVQTDSEGRYGYSTPLIVSGIEGRTVEFYVNEVLADQSGILQEAALTSLNLTIISSAPPASTTPTATGSKPPPGKYMPTSLRGTIMNDGVLVGAGLKVVAKVNGIEYASTITNAEGQYGFESLLNVEAQDGDTISFFINGTQADQTYSAEGGSMAQLNLTYKEAPEPPPTNTPVEDNSGTSQPTPSPSPASAPLDSGNNSIAQPVVIGFIVVMVLLCLGMGYMIMKRRPLN
jgi:hypothetical protein